MDSLREKDQETAVLEESEAVAAAGEEDEARLVTVHELVEAVERLQKTPDDSKLEQITEVQGDSQKMSLLAPHLSLDWVDQSRCPLSW